MSYVALYRKFRPTTFSDIVGQENVTKILKNQIKTGKVSHAYIFSGTRGTGKTSAAKVFARAVNCLHPIDGEPCNECEVCKNILNSNTTDVVEMDAASNNSVENIRQIRQEVVYATIDVKYRVYIIDEAHMLTTSAFNALLKTLEEPPENVIFILATTEQHKIPVTILSRCLRFEFNRLSKENILKRLEYVANEENIKYEKEALEYIAKLSDGALRDGLSLLDRCVSEGSEILKTEDVVRIIGIVDKDVVTKIVSSIINYDSIKAIESIDMVIEKGKDLRQLTNQITEEFLDKLINEKDDAIKERIIKIIDRLSKLDNDIKGSMNPSILVKATMVELCNVANLDNKIIEDESNKVNVCDKSIILELTNKINSLERKVLELFENKSFTLQNYLNENLEKDVKNTNIKTKEKIEDTIINETSNKVVENVEKPFKKQNESLDNLDDLTKFKDQDELKKQILNMGNIKVYSAIAGANIFEGKSSIVVMTNNSFAHDVLNKEDSINSIQEALKSKYGIEKGVVIRINNKNNNDKTKIQKLLDEKNVDYKQID